MPHPASNPRLSVDQVEALVVEHFPQVHVGGKIIFIRSVGQRAADLVMHAHERNVRPGGTVSGPAMFTLADYGIYVAILAELGEAGLQAVTTSLNINFLSRPGRRDMRAQVRLVKLGRRLAVGEVELYSDGVEDMVAHATATYAIPPPNLAVK